MFEQHPPYRRAMAGELTATDRQWLRLLADLLDTIHYHDLAAVGVDPATARAVLGLVALNERLSGEPGAA